MDLLSPNIQSLLRCATLCNGAEFKAEEERAISSQFLQREIVGDASDAGLQRFAELHMNNTTATMTNCVRELDVPFSRTAGFQLAIYGIDESLIKPTSILAPLVPSNTSPSPVAELKNPSESKPAQPISASATAPKAAGVSLQNTSLTNHPAAIISSLVAPAQFYRLLLVKGDPEVILGLCSKIRANTVEVELSTGDTFAYKNACTAFANKGERVFGFAELKLSERMFPQNYRFTYPPPNFPLKGLTLLGLIALTDPPRSSVPSAVQICRGAGIRLIMMTGDHPGTAMALAREVGMVQKDSMTMEEAAEQNGCSVQDVQPYNARAALITGVMLKNISRYRLKSLLRSHPETVFARVSAQQKLLVVEVLQEMGFRVAMIGDGVNDAPALKKSDMGIAMGISGSDISRDSAKMVILDDNFSSVVAGIEEGRLICDNLRKAMLYMMTSNVVEILPFIIFFLMSLPQPLSVATILYIDLGTEIIPAIALVREPPEGDVMKRPPRNTERRRIFCFKMIEIAYLQIGVLQTLAAFLMFYVVMAECGFQPVDIPGKQLWYSPVTVTSDSYGQEWTSRQRQELEKIVQGAFLTTIVVTQLANVVICRRRRLSFFQRHKWNPSIYTSMLIEASFFAILLYSPYVNVTLQVRPPEARWWLTGVTFSLIMFIYDEVRKFFVRKRPKESMIQKTFS